MKEKNSFWQVIRAVCILAVIMIHCPNGTALDQGTVQFWLYIFVRNLINFPVAVFIFMSGMFVNQHKLFDNPKAWIFSRGGVRLLVPYILWSAFYFLISFARGDFVTPLIIVKRLLVGKAAGPFYYIIVMIQLTLITYWLCMIHDAKIKALVWLFPPLMLAIIYFMAITKGSIPWWCDTLFPVWAGFYFLGIQVQEGDKRIELMLNTIGSLPFVTLAFIVNLCESIILVKAGIPFTLSVSQNRMGGFLFALSLIGFFYKKRFTEVNSKTLVLIGDDSYGIFYIHCIFIMIINAVVSCILDPELWVLRFMIALITTLICSEAVIIITRGLARKLHIEHLLKFIGF